ncbi:hypothetical protein CJ030_MR5G004109 [Morella rubra]|uniref:Uncharacterized protein n=1 Tax=Morella rubra TaxID=262757 RepID=A0A6A1VME5_9ROSI|nr:hypothetical protein CJ030_MR5G004109 [Morella rubra]
MKRGREFPSVTSRQLHSMSPIPSPTLSAPSPRVNEGMSQGTPACPSSCASTSASKRGRGRTRGVSLEKSLGSRSAKLSMHIPEGECGSSVFSTAATLSTKIGMLKRSKQNKKNRSKLTVNHTAGSRSFQRTRACMKNQESGNINPAELYKKNYTNKDGIWTSEGGREIYERMDAFQRQCDLEGKTYTEIEVYSEILGKKLGYIRGLGRRLSLAFINFNYTVF